MLDAARLPGPYRTVKRGRRRRADPVPPGPVSCRVGRWVLRGSSERPRPFGTGGHGSSRVRQPDSDDGLSSLRGSDSVRRRAFPPQNAETGTGHTAGPCRRGYFFGCNPRSAPGRARYPGPTGRELRRRRQDGARAAPQGVRPACRRGSRASRGGTRPAPRLAAPTPAFHAHHSRRVSPGPGDLARPQSARCSGAAGAAPSLPCCCDCRGAGRSAAGRGWLDEAAAAASPTDGSAQARREDGPGSPWLPWGGLPEALAATARPMLRRCCILAGPSRPRERADASLSRNERPARLRLQPMSVRMARSGAAPALVSRGCGRDPPRRRPGWRNLHGLPRPTAAPVRVDGQLASRRVSALCPGRGPSSEPLDALLMAIWVPVARGS